MIVLSRQEGQEDKDAVPVVLGRSGQFWPWAVRANWPWAVRANWPWAVRANFGPGPFGPIGLGPFGALFG